MEGWKHDLAAAASVYPAGDTLSLSSQASEVPWGSHKSVQQG